MSSQLPPLNIHFHPGKQSDLFHSQATELLYGGAAGGGKSFGFRGLSIFACTKVPGLQVYLFRRKRDDLQKSHVDGPKGYRALLQPWIQEKLVELTEREIRFVFNEPYSKIHLCHCKDAKDIWRYLSTEIHLALIDEVSEWTYDMYTVIRNRIRMVGIDVPEDFPFPLPSIRLGSNPGGVGHAWLKKTFIDPRPPMAIEQVSDEEGGMSRQFIPARIKDNPALEQDDPTYRSRLRGLYSPEIARAMEHGDWDIAVGAFFAEVWNRELHVIKPFNIPDYWIRIRAFDWGGASPFSVGWYAVSPGEEHNGVWMPAGAMVKYREWYGASEPEKGLNMRNEDIADGIKERESGENISKAVAGHDLFIKRGGPPMSETFAKRNVGFECASTNRVSGAKQVYDRLRGQDGFPMLYFMEHCRDSIRTIPVLSRSEKNLEDVKEEGLEDHCYDECRYACMSRPWTAPIPEPEPERDPGEHTFNELLADKVRQRKKVQRI